MAACRSCGTELVGAPKFCPECGTRLDAPPAAPRESRKVVTVLFSDVSDSTSLGEQLDAEAVRALMSRYFSAMKRVIERHGGTVEKFIGDAVMAVFGIPVIHEDDAIRAVRAAMQMREALAALNAELSMERGITIQTRTGITTGEVVAGDPAAGQTLVTGDTVNTAARLEQAAAPGEILIGEPTWRLVRDAITAEPLEGIAAKGKSLPVPAYRLTLVALGADGHQRHLDAPLIGRERELARIQQAYGDAVDQRSPQLFTLLGAAGVGKSRLIREFLGGLDADARVIRGRCLPYGEGITYWPLAEALRDAAGIVDSDDRAAAGRKLLTLLDGERDAELIAARLATAIGLSDEPAAQADLFWAARRTLEHLAGTRPLVVVFEDIHWAEPTFLDLIDHLAEWSRDAPIFLLAPARPELLDARAGWGGGKLNATTILLETLPADATGRLIDALPGGPSLPGALRQRIAAAAEGNPLFVEELMAMLVDDGVVRPANGGWEAVGDIDDLTIPPTIQALLAARLDRLSADERHVAERASVVGRVFEPEAVAALSQASSTPGLGDQLMALVRKELVRPDRSEVTGGDAFKFRHILIRDAAYTSLPKRERADLHERFADWLEQVSGDRAPEFAEIIGHHLEQARDYHVELGTPTPPDLGRRATEWLRSAAVRAWDRWDYPGAATLFEHAAAQAPSVEERLDLRERAAWALRKTGRYREAGAAAEALARDAEDMGHDAAAMRATLLATDTATFENTAVVPRLAEQLPDIAGRLRQLGDRRGLAIAGYVESGLHIMGVRFDQAFAALKEALDHAAASDSSWIGHFVQADLAGVAELGSTPIAVLRAYVADSYADQPAHWSPGLRAITEADIAILEDDIEEASAAMDRARAVIHEHGSFDSSSAGVAFWAALLLYAGQLERATKHGIEGQDQLIRVGNENLRLTMAGVVGEALAMLGRAEEAAPYIAEASTADASDVGTHVFADRARAWVALGRGDLAEADRYATQAMHRLERTEAPLDRAQTLVLQSAVAAARGDRDGARAHLDQARGLALAKGARAVVRAIDERRSTFAR